MNRRTVVATASIGLSFLVSGCLFGNAPSETENDTVETGVDEKTGQKNETNSETEHTENREPPAETETEPASTRSSDSQIVFNNLSAVDYRGRYILTMDAEVVFEKEFEVAAGERQSVDSEIAETGQYELTVTTETGHEASFPFSIDEYALRAGSNLIVEMSEDDIRILLEE